MDSYLLNNKLNTENIKLNCTKAGLIKIRKIEESGEVVLDVNDDYLKVGNNNFDSIDLLSYYFDVPINLEKRLTYSGSYIPLSLKQSRILIRKNNNFDSNKFDEYFIKLNKMCSAADKKIFKKGVKISNILHIYQNAQKLFPEFYEESYINLIRILDLIVEAGNARQWSNCIVKKTSKYFIKENFSKLDKKKYKEHIYYANKIFISKSKSPCPKNTRRSPNNISFYDNECKKIFYSILWCVYEYRNKWIHNGFKFPYKIKEYFKNFDILGISLGEGRILDYENSIFQDIHEELSKTKKWKGKRYLRNYKKYYLLLPTWIFLNKVVRYFIDKELIKIK